MRGVALLLLAAVVLAGCSGSSGDPNGESTSTSSSATTSGSKTSTGTAKPSASSSGTTTASAGDANQAPTAVLAVNRSAAAPLQANFTLDGSDPDGDALTWVLSFGDGTDNQTGTTLPTNLTHAYAQAGTYNATLLVTDGSLSGTMALTLDITEAGPVSLEAIRIEGTITGAYAGAPVVGGEYTATNTHTFELLGQPPLMRFVMGWDDTTIDLDYDVVAPDGTEAGSAANYNEPTGQAFDAVEAEILVEDPALLAQVGVWTVNVYPGTAIEGGYTIDITFV